MYPNKIRISNGEGQVSITAISRAFEVGQVAEDFDLSKYTSVEHDSERYRFKAAKGGSWG